MQILLTSCILMITWNLLLILVLCFVLRHLFSLLLLLIHHLLAVQLGLRWTTWLATCVLLACLLAWAVAGWCSVEGAVVLGLGLGTAGVRSAADVGLLLYGRGLDAQICLTIDVLLWSGWAVAPGQWLLSLSCVSCTWQITLLLIGCSQLFLALWVLALAKNDSFEILEGDHDDRDIIQTLSVQWVLQYWFNSEPALLMDALSRPVVGILLPLVSVAAVPDTFAHVLVWHFVEDAVTCQQDEIMIFMYLELPYLWLSFDDIYVSTSICQLGFWITKGSTHGKTAWQDSDGTNDKLRILDFWRSCLHVLLIDLDWLRCRRLIYLPACFDDPVVLIDVWWLVVSAQRHHDLTTVDRDDCSAVSDVGAVACVTDYQNHNCTASWSIDDDWCTSLVSALAHVEEGLLRLFEAANDCFFWVHRKTVLLDDEMVQLITKKLCARVSSMSVIHTKERAFRPVLLFSMCWLSDINYNWYSILIVIPDQPLIRDCRICPHNSISFDRAFGRLLVGNDDSRSWLQRQLLRFLFFISWHLMNHLVDVESRQLLYLLIDASRRIHFDLCCYLMLALFEERFDIKVRHANELRSRASWRRQDHLLMMRLVRRSWSLLRSTSAVVWCWKNIHALSWWQGWLIIWMTSQEVASCCWWELFLLLLLLRLSCTRRWQEVLLAPPLDVLQVVLLKWHKTTSSGKWCSRSSGITSWSCITWITRFSLEIVFVWLPSAQVS